MATDLRARRAGIEPGPLAREAPEQQNGPIREDAGPLTREVHRDWRKRN
jgi:hypothetical protein